MTTIILITLIFTICIFLLVSLTMGIELAIRFLPLLFFLILILVGVGLVLWQILPIILIVLLINYIFGNKKTKKRHFYYKTYTQQDFEDMFRNQSQWYENGNNSGYQNNSFQWTEDKTKYYKILGINEGATQNEIKKAYRDLAKKHHPDMYAKDSKDTRDYHEKRFKEINEAYEKLQ